MSLRAEHRRAVQLGAVTVAVALLCLLLVPHRRQRADALRAESAEAASGWSGPIDLSWLKFRWPWGARESPKSAQGAPLAPVSYVPVGEPERAGMRSRPGAEPADSAAPSPTPQPTPAAPSPESPETARRLAAGGAGGAMGLLGAIIAFLAALGVLPLGAMIAVLVLLLLLWLYLGG